MTENQSSATAAIVPRRHVRYLMLVYSILFLIVSTASAGYDFKIGVVYFIWTVIIYFLANVGNFAYSFRYPLGVRTKYWIVVAYLFVIQVVAENVLSVFQDFDTFHVALLWGLTTLFCFPTFWANFRLALEKSDQKMIE